MAAHAKDALGGARISQILNLPLAVPTPEAARAEGLITGQDGKILDLVTARVAAVCAIVADEGAIAEQQKVRIGIKEGAAGVAPEAVNVPEREGVEGVSEVSRSPMSSCETHHRLPASSNA